MRNYMKDPNPHDGKHSKCDCGQGYSWEADEDDDEYDEDDDEYDDEDY